MRLLRRTVSIAALLGLAGCQLSYYGQAIRGQTQILAAQRPVTRILADPTAPQDLKSRLTLAQELISFAEEELLLPAGKNYQTYADIHRKYVLWSVFATPELSSKAIAWSYPVVGSLEYRGYFSENAARAFARAQRDKGLDTALAPVPAYSTLGVFRDPLLNTFLHESPEELAGLIFHELTHRKIYRPGETSFNEALAVAMEREGVRRWLRKQGDPVQLAKYERRLQAVDSFVRRVLQTRESLNALYQSPIPEETKRLRKRQMLDQLQEQIRAQLTAAGTSRKDDFWLQEPLTNAHLNVISAYYRDVPRFERLLADQNGDLRKFFTEVENLPAQEAPDR
jgi:predicted aminopeptidase